MWRPSWRLGGALALALVACSGLAPARAQSAKDPEVQLKELNAWYADQIKKAQDAKTQPDYRALMAERLERAKAAVKDVDPAKVEPAKCLALAQLFQAVRDSPHMVASAQRFLTSNPEAQPRYTAHQLLLQGYAATGDADGIVKVLSEIKPPNPQGTAMLAAYVGGQYAEIVADKKGVPAGLELIAKAEANVPFADMLAKPDVTGRDGKPAPAPEKSAAESAIVQIATGRSALLEKQGKKDEALAALEAGKAKLSAGSRLARGLESKIRLARLPGSSAPELTQDRGYGNFKSINDYKGKVVVVEFTAHW